jgi:hypothetical protein
VTPTTLPCGVTLSASTVLSIAAAHIGHFAEQLERCGSGVNHAETRYYLELWREIRTAVSRGRELGSEQLGELHDAVTSGDYEALLQSDELLAVLGMPVANARPVFSSDSDSEGGSR